ncbi:cephalotocin receptor 2-like [Lingula anatina]|uniref:Cephalotocin receptor 2-like n=1 Tax=Lingula anatina TaxID=7574 RepID=A0A1S3KF71_LINAN|nr:cephalotocin receptor 2-like [Lingula anatina]|eukprot:XP_013421283.1 cephalotocin receptor 2-like [Lingula anatina]
MDTITTTTFLTSNAGQEGAALLPTAKEPVAAPILNITSLNATNCSVPVRVEWLVRTEIGVLGAVFFMAIFGNVCVLVALYLYKKKLSRMHYFIMHLSISDLLVAVWNILPQLATDITFRFQVSNDGLCRIVKYFQVFVLYLSCYVLVMTGVDRYYAICHPLSNYAWSTRKVNTMIGIAWGLAALVSAPQLALFSYREVSPYGCGIYDCTHIYEFLPPWVLKAYITTFAILLFFIPLVILIFVYGRICWEVWGNPSGRLSTGSRNSGTAAVTFNCPSSIPSGNEDDDTTTPRAHGRTRLSRAKVKTIKLTFTIIIAYVACWTPFFVIQLWWLYDETAPEGDAAFVVIILLASLNSCCNPWIYLIFNSNLIRQILPCPSKSSQRASSHNCNRTAADAGFHPLPTSSYGQSSRRTRFDSRSSSLTSMSVLTKTKVVMDTDITGLKLGVAKKSSNSVSGV